MRRSDDQGVVESSHVAALGEGRGCSRFSEYVGNSIRLDRKVVMDLREGFV